MFWKMTFFNVNIQAAHFIYVFRHHVHVHNDENRFRYGKKFKLIRQKKVELYLSQ